MKVMDLTYRGNMTKSKVEGKGTMSPFSKKLIDTIKISPTEITLIKHTEFSIWTESHDFFSSCGPI